MMDEKEDHPQVSENEESETENHEIVELENKKRNRPLLLSGIKQTKIIQQFDYIPLIDMNVTELVCDILDRLKEVDGEMFTDLTRNLKSGDIMYLLFIKYPCLNKYKKIKIQ